MEVSSENNTFYENLKILIYVEELMEIKGNDYDGMTYKIEYVPESGILALSFKSHCFSQLWGFRGDEMLKEFYPGTIGAFGMLEELE